MNFTNNLQKLVSETINLNHRNKENMAEIIENLAGALGFTIAMASDGDGKTIDTMIEGATNYAHYEAVEKAKIVKALPFLRPYKQRNF